MSVRLREKHSWETLPSYADYIGRRLAEAEVPELQEWCRKYAVGVDDLLLALLAEKIGGSREIVQQKLEAYAVLNPGGMMALD